MDIFIYLMQIYMNLRDLEWLLLFCTGSMGMYSNFFTIKKKL